MPSQSILDFANVDLTHTRFTRDDIYSKLKQRGRFAVLDGVLHFDPNDPVIVGFKEIRADDWWASDHIPGRPLFPGVLMIESAAQLCTFDYMARHPEMTQFLGFGGLEETRFRGTVEPG